MEKSKSAGFRGMGTRVSKKKNKIVYPKEPLLILRIYKGLHFNLKEDGEYVIEARLKGVVLESRVYSMKASQVEYKLMNLFMFRLSEAYFRTLCEEGCCVDLTVLKKDEKRKVCVGRGHIPLSLSASDVRKEDRKLVALELVKRSGFTYDASPAVQFCLTFKDCNESVLKPTSIQDRKGKPADALQNHSEMNTSFSNYTRCIQPEVPKVSDGFFNLVIILGWIHSFESLCPWNSNPKSAYRISFVICGKEFRSDAFNRTAQNDDDLKTYLGDKFVIVFQAAKEEFCKYLEELVLQMKVERVSEKNADELIGTTELMLKDFVGSGVTDFVEIKQSTKIIPTKEHEVPKDFAKLYVVARLRTNTESARKDTSGGSQIYGDPQDMNVEESRCSAAVASGEQRSRSLEPMDVLRSPEGLNISEALDKSEIHKQSQPTKITNGSSAYLTKASVVLEEDILIIGRNPSTSAVEPPEMISSENPLSFQSTEYSRVYELEFDCVALRIRSTQMFKFKWIVNLSHPFLLLSQNCVLSGKPKDSGINRDDKIYTDFDFDEKLKLIFYYPDKKQHEGCNQLEVWFSCPESEMRPAPCGFVAHTTIPLDETFVVEVGKTFLRRVNVFSLKNPSLRIGFFHYGLTLLNRS